MRPKDRQTVTDGIVYSPAFRVGKFAGWTKLKREYYKSDCEFETWSGNESGNAYFFLGADGELVESL